MTMLVPFPKRALLLSALFLVLGFATEAAAQESRVSESLSTSYDRRTGALREAVGVIRLARDPLHQRAAPERQLAEELSRLEEDLRRIAVSKELGSQERSRIQARLDAVTAAAERLELYNTASGRTSVDSRVEELVVKVSAALESATRTERVQGAASALEALSQKTPPHRHAPIWRRVAPASEGGDEGGRQ